MKPLPIQADDLPAHPPARARADTRPTAYPVLLVTSTLLTATFCTLYLTKPVVRIEQVAAGPTPATRAATPAGAAIPPAPAAKPAATTPPRTPLPANPADLAAAGRPSPFPAAAFEETNLKVQHVLSVAAPDGEIGRVVTDVPVLYQSRTLRWDLQQVTLARSLLEQLRAHQEKSRALRAEGIALLAAWQSLVDDSIPTPALRADSPTLPVNQPGESSRRGPAGQETADSIEVETAAIR